MSRAISTHFSDSSQTLRVTSRRDVLDKKYLYASFSQTLSIFLILLGNFNF